MKSRLERIKSRLEEVEDKISKMNDKVEKKPSPDRATKQKRTQKGQRGFKGAAGQHAM